ncbi:MAG: hypothetical protein KAH95_00190 [Spirochaetales bacterium]|nr:hypothetical protein [Spirochaetales bacterium]
MNTNYLILIGDIIESKKIDDRAEVQRKLSSIFTKLNKNCNNIISPFTITLGDEFQAVFNSSKGIIHSLLTISKLIFPYEIRYSLAIGKLSTELNRKTSIGMDGPVFYSGRQGIENLKNKKGVFSLHTESQKYDLLISAGMDMILSEIYRYKSTNRANIFVRTLEKMPQGQVAQDNGVSRQNINKNTKRWLIEQKVVLMEAFENLMEEEL